MRTYLVIIVIFFIACREKHPHTFFSKSPRGYYYHLISFTTEKSNYHRGNIARVSATFGTQRDSVFWDSRNNMSNHFFVRIDTGAIGFVGDFVSRAAEGDSAFLMVKPLDFFSQQFENKKVPYFCEKDTAVHIHLKVDKVYTAEEFHKVYDNLKELEPKLIESYFKDVRDFETARDEAGFYWLERPLPMRGAVVRPGDDIRVVFRGQFLNGRPLDSSGGAFEFTYGSPDQVLKGLNIVIGRLKYGQNAKIILPSRLAFGELGSSNGTVPPYTPLIYTITVLR